MDLLVICIAYTGRLDLDRLLISTENLNVAYESHSAIILIKYLKALYFY